MMQVTLLWSRWIYAAFLGRIRIYKRSVGFGVQRNCKHLSTFLPHQIPPACRQKIHFCSDHNFDITAHKRLYARLICCNWQFVQNMSIQAWLGDSKRDTFWVQWHIFWIKHHELMDIAFQDANHIIWPHLLVWEVPVVKIVLQGCSKTVWKGRAPSLTALARARPHYHVAFEWDRASIIFLLTRPSGVM